MDNLGKALYMATGVLLFIIALTSSVILYNGLIEYANTTLVISDLGDRAELANPSTSYSKRDIHDEEVIASIIQINSLYIDKIEVILESGAILIFRPDNYSPEFMFVDGREKRITEYDFARYIDNGIYNLTYKDNSLVYKLLESEEG